MKRTIMYLMLLLIAVSCQKNTDKPVHISTEESSSTAIFDSTYGLLAHFTFNNTLDDVSGNGHEISFEYGKIKFPVGHINSDTSIRSMRIVTPVLMFTDNFMTFQKTDSFTVSLWIKCNQIYGAGRILSNEYPEGNFRIVMYETGTYGVSFAGLTLTDTTGYKKNWVYITYTYNNGQAKLYRNGTPIASGVDTSTEELHYGPTLGIGVKASEAYDGFIGNMQDLRVYNYDLKAEDILALSGH